MYTIRMSMGGSTYTIRMSAACASSLAHRIVFSAAQVFASEAASRKSCTALGVRIAIRYTDIRIIRSAWSFI
jgi:hypothetical protein